MLGNSTTDGRTDEGPSTSRAHAPHRSTAVAGLGRSPEPGWHGPSPAFTARAKPVSRPEPWKESVTKSPWRGRGKLAPLAFSCTRIKEAGETSGRSTGERRRLKTVLISPTPWRPRGNVNIQKGMGDRRTLRLLATSLDKPRGTHVPLRKLGFAWQGATITTCRHPPALSPRGHKDLKQHRLTWEGAGAQGETKNSDNFPRGAE